jgi:hypothetical protein
VTALTPEKKMPVGVLASKFKGKYGLRFTKKNGVMFMSIEKWSSHSKLKVVHLEA